MPEPGALGHEGSIFTSVPGAAGPTVGRTSEPRPIAGRRVLVTGSAGFIGVEVCRDLVAAGAEVWGAVRSGASHPVPGATAVSLPDLGDRAVLERACTGMDAVVHLAARVHVMREGAADSLAEHRRVNVEGTRNVCEAAAAAGVTSMVFASTVKAVGESTGVPWTETTPPAPQDPYGMSKLEAEEVVRELARRDRLHAPILRLPLVYGPAVKGNMRRLFGLVARGLPLPFGRVRNRRSLLYLGNLTAAIRAVLATPAAGEETFFVSDGQDLSLAELIEGIGRALGRPARLLPVPVALLRLVGRVGDGLGWLGPSPLTSAEIDRLTESLVIDSSRLGRVTGFRPPFTVDEGLRATASWYRGRGGRST